MNPYIMSRIQRGVYPGGKQEARGRIIFGLIVMVLNGFGMYLMIQDSDPGYWFISIFIFIGLIYVVTGIMKYKEFS